MIRETGQPALPVCCCCLWLSPDERKWCHGSTWQARAGLPVPGDREGEGHSTTLTTPYTAYTGARRHRGWWLPQPITLHQACLSMSPIVSRVTNIVHRVTAGYKWLQAQGHWLRQWLLAPRDLLPHCTPRCQPASHLGLIHTGAL